MNLNLAMATVAFGLTILSGACSSSDALLGGSGGAGGGEASDGNGGASVDGSPLDGCTSAMDCHEPVWPSSIGYSRSCSNDLDCALVQEIECTSWPCGCFNRALNKSDAARYASDRATYREQCKERHPGVACGDLCINTKAMCCGGMCQSNVEPNPACPGVPEAGGAADATERADVSDIADAAGWSCGDKTCSASQYCLSQNGGPRPLPDTAPPPGFHSCESIPPRCGSKATCACVVPYTDDAGGVPRANSCTEQNPLTTNASFALCDEDGPGRVHVHCAIP